MMLLRASNMNVMRLQLAAERQDRRLAMAAMDDLLGLDRELSCFVKSIPGAAPDAFVGRLDAQKNALVAERLVLARGKIGPALAPVPIAANAPAGEDEADHEFEAAQGGSWLPKALIALFVISLAALALAFGLGLVEIGR